MNKDFSIQYQILTKNYLVSTEPAVWLITFRIQKLMLILYSLICLTFLLFENLLMSRNKMFTLHKMTIFILSFVGFKLTHYEPL